MRTIREFCLATALVAAAAGFAVPASAAITSNALTNNGLHVNGLAPAAVTPAGSPLDELDGVAVEAVTLPTVAVR